MRSQIKLGIPLVGLALGLGIWGCVGERVGASRQSLVGQGMPPGGVRVWPRPYGWQGDGGRPLRYGIELDNVKAGWVREVNGGEAVGDVVQEKMLPMPMPEPSTPLPDATKKPVSCLFGDGSASFEVTLLSPEGDSLVDGDGFAALVAAVCEAFDPSVAPAAL